MGFSDRDKRLMQIALEEAKLAADSGNYPVGAILVVNDEVIARERNRKENKADRISHAEMLLFLRHSEDILRWEKIEKRRIELFTTFEPCLMCLGTSVVHRVHRIVVACRDPRGDISTINPNAIGPWYERNWPKIDYGLCRSESWELMSAFFAARNDAEGREAAELINQMKPEE